MRPAFRLPLLLLAAAVFAAEARALARDPHAFLDAQAAAGLERHGVPGVAYALIEDGTVTRIAAHGRMRAGDGAPVTQDTRFQVASLSKSVTATAILALVEEGRLELDAPVGRYLSRWQLPAGPWDPADVTLRRVLSHTAGLSVNAAPGTGYAYSGGGYTLLQLLIEEVTGERFADAMQRRVLAPLGMRAASFDPEPDDPRIARAHDAALHPIPNRRYTAQAAAGLHASVEDLARFVVANLGRHPLLAPETVAEMHRTVEVASGPSPFGLGFRVMAGGRLVGHSGANLGFRARMAFVPEQRAGLVVLTNAESGSDLVEDLFCIWDDAFAIGLLRGACEQSLRARASRIAAGRAFGTLALGAMLLAVIGLVTGRRGLRVPLGIGQKVTLIAVALASLSGALVCFTPLGARVFAGVVLEGRSFDYLSPSLRPLVASFFPILAALALWLLTGPVRSGRASRGTAR
ncbi:MAG: beta-lactamase family protein [Myxococcales bacterium]|nr:beta-lactamase family protein [Myxococcales bacterium]